MVAKGSDVMETPAHIRDLGPIRKPVCAAGLVAGIGPHPPIGGAGEIMDA